MAVLNGGGDLLKLHTTAGKIRLQFLDSETALRESLMREQKERINQRLQEHQIERVKIDRSPVAAPEPGPKTDWLESWLPNLEVAFTGRLPHEPPHFPHALPPCAQP